LDGKKSAPSAKIKVLPVGQQIGDHLQILTQRFPMLNQSQSDKVLPVLFE
jgi:hypothetical protein